MKFIRHGLYALALSYAAAVVLTAQALHPQPPAPIATETAPALAENLELRRTNLVLRQALLEAQVQNLRATIERESEAIRQTFTSVKEAVEKEHPGWTLSDSGVVVKVPEKK